MEQGGTEEDMNQQDQNRQPIKSTENTFSKCPQKCPRCDSDNTKFCYYNNYSLTQPRYFCKACRRYWTQGGTLRNVPLGGGSHKGKRAKSSSSSGEDSKSPPPPPPPPPSQNMATVVSRNSDNLGLPVGNLPTISCCSDGGIFSFLAWDHNPPLNFCSGQYVGSGSEGFSVPSLLKQQSQIQQHQMGNGDPNMEMYQMGNGDPNMQIYQMGNGGQSIEEALYLYPSDQTTVQPNSPLNSWTQSFINNNTTSGGSSLNPNEWPHDLSGYGPPPPF